MDLVKLLKRIQNSYLIKGEYLFNWLKENDKYIVYDCYEFVDGVVNVPIGDYTLYAYDKETDELVQLNPKETDLSKFKDVPIPKGFEIKEGYIF